MASMFESIHVGNFNGQRGSDRFPPNPTSPPPSLAQWRANVVALSQHFNLYFAAFGNAIHITIPRDLHQTLPRVPDLVLHLPSTAAAIHVGGYMPHSHPHTINHIKIGELGNFEILLIACDDGDVLAYYTRLLDIETTRQSADCKKGPVSLLEPFFHQNVGRSAWGMAIHQQSRLIAVSSNLWEVTVFHHALAAEHDIQTGRWRYRRHLSDPIESLSDEAYQRAALSDDRAFSHAHNLSLETRAQDMITGGYNSKMTMFLGPSGDNIPSIDFANDEEGEALFVLATDINGNLWSLNLETRESIMSPPPQGSLNYVDHHPEDVLRGWGVMCIPLSCFRRASDPQEAVGVADLENVIHLSDLYMKHSTNLKFLDISAGIGRIAVDRHAPSFYHPSSRSHAVLASDPPAELVPDNELQQHKNQAGNTSKAALEYLRKPESVITRFIQPTMLPFLSERSWRVQLISILESGRWGGDVERWLDSLYTMSRKTRMSPAAVIKDVEAFCFLSSVPREWRHLIKDWDTLQIAAHNFQSLKNVEAALETIDPRHETPPPDDLAMSSPKVPGYAIMRTTNRDIELLPQHENALPTIIQGFAAQAIEDVVIRRRLTMIDRLNMMALIPELSLLIVATQSGRAGVFTLTKLDDGFCELGPVVTFRLETILPLAMHERAWRPNVPLLGMAVAPLQGVDGVGRAVQKRIWRVVLHYMDHSILSYEVKRGDDGDNLVIL